FQSMLRTSSPGWYSRTSANSIPCPLNTERYSPENSEFTRPRVRSSSSFTWRRMSGGTPRPPDNGRRTSDVGACPRHDAVRITLLVRAMPYAVRPRRVCRRASRALDGRENPGHDFVARHLFGFRLV